MSCRIAFKWFRSKRIFLKDTPNTVPQLTTFQRKYKVIRRDPLVETLSGGASFWEVPLIDGWP